jgi:sugar phosphate isomerase/epimerase
MKMECSSPRIHLGGTARSPEDVVALHELGLPFAEIPITAPERFLALKESYQTLRKQLGLYYLCHGPLEGEPNDANTLEIFYLPKVMTILSLMPQLDMRLLTLHLWLDPRFVREDSIAYKIRLLNKIIVMARDLGITICLENLSESASHLAPIFDALPLLKLTLDLGHAELLTKQNTSVRFMREYPKKIKHIHLHDNRGGDSPDDDLHLPVGDGTIDFEIIFRELHAIGYDGTITLELRPQEIRKCLGYVKQLLNISEH